MIELKPFTRADFGRLIAWVTSEDFLAQWAGPAFIYPLDDAQLEKYLQLAETEPPTRKIFKVVDSSTSRVVGHIELDRINLKNGSASICRILVGEPSRGGRV